MMHPKTLLMLFQGQNSEVPVLRYAISLAKQYHTQLESLYIVPEVEDAYMAYGGGEVNIPYIFPKEIFASAEHHINKMKKKAHTLFTEIVDSSDPSGDILISWQEERGHAEDIIPSKGAINDIILMGRSLPVHKNKKTINLRDPYQQALQAAIFSTGRPVMVIPPYYEAEGIGRTVAIAWDNNPHTVHALHAAMPFLPEAQKVYIYTVQHSSTAVPSVERLLSYLQLHNIQAEHVNIKQQEGDSVGMALNNMAKEQQVDLIVMGAYSHHRLYQMLMGGVTDFMLHHADVPLLMMY